MLIFIDESGDSGFKLESGSSPIFVIAMVVFKENHHAEQVNEVISDLRQRLQWKKQREFKFSKLNDTLRMEFIRTVAQSPFNIHTLIVDKKNVEINEDVSTNVAFYDHFIDALLIRNSTLLKNARLRIDGDRKGAFQKSFSARLRKTLKPTRVKNVKFIDSKTDVLIQLADMVAGSFNRAYNPSFNDQTYIDLLQGRVIDCWEYAKG